MHYPHIAQFAGSNDDTLIERVAQYFRQGLERNAVGILITNEERRSKILELLPETDAITCYDARETLGKFIRGGKVHPASFDAVVGHAVREAMSVARGRPIYAYGDMVGELWGTGKRQTAADLEWFWNDLGSQIPFTLYCGYPIDPQDSAQADVQMIADLHSSIVA
ncbi:MAG: MEDS domain-containing protein [Candidatus Baltobacteraceae bacterium]